MRGTSIPSVLTPPAPNSALSMERALKQIKSLLNDVEPANDSHEDRLNASIDDIEVMLACIDRG